MRPVRARCAPRGRGPSTPGCAGRRVPNSAYAATFGRSISLQKKSMLQAESEVRRTNVYDEVRSFRRRLFARLVTSCMILGGTSAIGCGSEVHSDDGDCPNHLVTPDAAITGFSAVGEWRTDAVCQQYCTANFPVCQLASATSVRCQKGCD